MRARSRRLLPAVAAVAAFYAFAPQAAARKTHKPEHHRRFVATAYCQTGITKSGKPVRPGVVAADPRVLPLGSLIRVSDATGYSGDYEVLDTGAKIKGHHIDIFMYDEHEALEFGRRHVVVEVLRYGERRG